jgi:hypothetical protein
MASRRRVTAALFVALAGAAAEAQVDFSGNWVPLFHEDQPERLPGPEIGDYSGIPLNDAGRLRGDSYDADRISVVTEYQCRPHGGDYSMRGLANMRVEQVLDPLTQRVLAIHLRMNFQEQERTIWLDGRAHPPPLAAHTFAGFSTGTWNGNMLDVVTTHLKTNYLRRNGLPRSDQATFTEHWVRRGDYLTVTTLIRDPVFLTEPLVRSQTWALAPAQRLGRDVCVYVPELVGEPDYVPNHLPGANPFLREIIDWYGLPEAGVRGGSETLYPEFLDRLGVPSAAPPRQCERYCRCGEFGRGCDLK